MLLDLNKILQELLIFPEGQTHWKDLSLITLFIGCSIGAWYGWKQDKKFKKHLNRMNRDMEGLQNAERALETLQKELEFAKQAKENVATEKENLEKKLLETETDSGTLHNSYSDLEVSQMKAEIEVSLFVFFLTRKLVFEVTLVALKLNASSIQKFDRINKKR